MPETQPDISQNITVPAQNTESALLASRGQATPEDGQSGAPIGDQPGSAKNQGSPPASDQPTGRGEQRDASGPAVALASNPNSFDPMANGPQPPALEPRLAAVAAIADPHLRQHVEANVRLQTQRQVAAFTDTQRQAKAQAKQVIDQGGDLSTIPAKLMLQIDTPGRQVLRDYVLAHGNPVTDPVTYYGLKNQALDDPAGFQSVDLSNHMARLKPADYAELQQLQTNLRNNQLPADRPLQQAYKANTDLMLRQLNLPSGSSAAADPAANDNTPGARQAALIRQAVDQHVAATELATGRKMTPDDHHDLLQQVSALRQTQAVPVTSTTPNIAGTTSIAPLSAWGAKDAAAAESAGELATGGEALVGGSLMATLAPILGLSAGVLAVTSTPTASPALDEYQPPISGSSLKPFRTIQSGVLPKIEEEDDDDDESCEEQRRKCYDLCERVEPDPDGQNVYWRTFQTCMRGCLNPKCGGNRISHRK